MLLTCLVCTACPGGGDETPAQTGSETGDGDDDPGDGDGDPGDGDADSGDVCGDGVVTGDEECDLGDANADTGECTSSCTMAVCGDGLVYAEAEACDGAGETADCNANCTVAACGDGIVNPSAGESCEGTVDNNGSCDMCQLNCDADYANCNNNPADGCEILLCAGGTCDNPQLQPGSVEFDYTGALEFFTIPACVKTLTIEALGASGGSGMNVGYPGGFGARIKGDFDVNAGDELTLLVGGAGLDATDEAAQGGGSGGGGSFVADANGDPMLVAGGGGGANYVTMGGTLLAPGGDGRTEQAGQPGGGDNGGVGGNNGSGGGTLDWAGWHGGTGGGGFLGAGLGPSNGNPDEGSPNQPGEAFVDGGAGGMAGDGGGRNGGFGGGGAAGFCGGGGGGYSGGGAAGTATDVVGGGGGGSINLGDNQDNQAGNNSGDGMITLSW
ncbi:hypothetical protein [Enhygromyxa salina]|uniref:hypothetical protein n=1 Tax=Enhygromyxa salina TaxID=215803 RepID=UPI0011B285A4|nr:hypothetical protein [Enhygromyxa salina]